MTAQRSLNQMDAPRAGHGYGEREAELRNNVTLANNRATVNEKDLLASLFADCEGFVNVRAIGSGKPPRSEFYPADRLQWVPGVIERYRDHNIYFGVATREHGNGKKGGIVHIPALWADCDFKSTPREKADRLISELPVRASVTVESGGGYHLYWLLKEPASAADIPRVEDANRKLAVFLSADFGVCDASHILRLPGTLNYKYDPARPVTVKDNSGARYNLQDFDIFPEVPGRLAELALGKPKPAPAGGGVAGPSTRYGEGALLDETVKVSRASEGCRNEALNKSAFALGQLIAGGELDRGQAEAALYGVAISKGLTERETRATIKSGIEAGMREPRSAPQSTDKSRQTKAPVKNSAPEASKETATEEKKDLKDAILIAEAFRNLTENPRTYYLKPFIWRGNIVLISGARGVGKTNFGLSLAAAVSAGGKIGPWEAEGNTYCLYLDAEMMVTDIQDRLEMLGVPSGIPLFIYSEALAYQLGLPRGHLMNEAWREKLKQLLIDFGIQVLFLDNLSSLTPGADENAKQEWDPVNQWLIELRFLGISVALIHHLGKSGTQRGTSGREDSIDISIELLKPSDYSPEDGCRFIAHFGKHRIPQRDLHLIGDTEFKLTPSEDGRHYCFAHANPKTEAKKECLKLFSDGYDQKSICEQAGLSKGYVSKLKKSFIADGLLSKRGELTPKGWSFLHPQKSDEVGNQ